jgi:polysaccharide biosynthesis transport protein
MTQIQTQQPMPQIVRYGGRPTQGSPGGAQREGITGKDIWRIIRKRKWLIIIPTILLTIFAFVGTFIWLKYYPTYAASAYLLIRPPSEGPLVRVRNEYSSDIVERYVMSHVQLIRQQRILTAAVETEDVQRTEWFDQDKINAVERLMEEVSVGPIPGTDLVRVTMRGRDDEEVAVIASAIAREYARWSAASDQQQMDASVRTVESTISDITRQLDHLRQEKARLQAGVELPELQARGGVMAIRLRSLSEEIVKYQMARSQAESSLASLQQQVESREILQSPGVIGALDMDPRLRSLRQSELGLTLERDAAMRKFGPDHLHVKNIETRLKSVSEQVLNTEKRVISYSVNAMLSKAVSDLEAYKSMLVDMQKQYDQFIAEAKDIERTTVRLGELESEEKSLTDDLKRIQGRQTELKTAGSGRMSVTFRSAAEIPKKPSTPRWIVNIPAGIFIGLFLGTGLAFLLELVDTSIKSPADIVRRADLPVLGSVPHINDLEEDVEDIRLAVMDSASTLVSEAFRQIRTCLMFSAPAEQRRSLLVTSPLPGDGRTTVALNLAASVSQGGKKVLLIDTNFRQPVLTRLFSDVLGEEGLSNALVGQAAWQDVVKEVRENLHVMPSGPLPPNPAELLGSEQMRQMLAECLAQYDQIIFDGPPCLVVSDAAILGSVADGVILVIRAGKNTHGIVQRARDTLGRVGAKVLGGLLNGVRVTTGGYLRKNYETFYEYQEQPKLPA